MEVLIRFSKKLGEFLVEPFMLVIVMMLAVHVAIKSVEYSLFTDSNGKRLRHVDPASLERPDTDFSQFTDVFSELDWSKDPAKVKQADLLYARWRAGKSQP